MMAALGRAAHLVHYGSRAVLQDWLAWPFVGPDADGVWELGKALVGDDLRPIGTWFAARSRVSEDWLAASGCGQHVILGAGLDSSAWRSTLDVQVFEVDHPATQAWKQERVAFLDLPERPVWLPLDFEREQLGPALTAAGVDEGSGVFVSWHGVIPYLSKPAIAATLAELPACALAISYVLPKDQWSADVLPAGMAVMSAIEAFGEPWTTLTTRGELTELVAEAGFEVVDDVGPEDIEPTYGIKAINYERIALARKSPA